MAKRNNSFSSRKLGNAAAKTTTEKGLYRRWKSAAKKLELGNWSDISRRIKQILENDLEIFLFEVLNFLWLDP